MSTKNKKLSPEARAAEKQMELLRPLRFKKPPRQSKQVRLEKRWYDTLKVMSAEYERPLSVMLSRICESYFSRSEKDQRN